MPHAPPQPLADHDPGGNSLGGDTLAQGLPALIARRAAQAARTLAAHPGARSLPPPVLPTHPPGLTWRNWLFAAPGLRRAHVELFGVAGQFSVLHICLMPALNRPDPVFGLDLIGGRTVAPGMFIDLSPMQPDHAPSARRVLAAPGPEAFGKPRPLPGWGAIFSPDFICVRPGSLDDAARALDHGFAVLGSYLAAFHRPPDGPQEVEPADAAVDAIRAAQGAYCQAQRANQHTRRMLAGFVGAGAADAFIDTVLFPLPA